MVQRQKWLDEIANNELIQWIISIANRGFASTDGLSGADAVLARPFLAMNSLITGIDAAFELDELKDALKKVAKAKGLFNLGPIAEKLNDTTNLDPALVQNSGLTLRMVAVGLESGQEKWVDQDGTLIGPDGKEGTVPLPDAVLASAAIPVVFRPQALLDETFVDEECAPCSQSRLHWSPALERSTPCRVVPDLCRCP